MPTWLVITVAWLLGRAFDMALLAAVGVPERPRVDTNRLLTWDGLWYREIIEHGYARPEVWPPGLGGWTTFPFFPLFPYSSRLLHDLGMPMLPSLTLLPNLAALVAAFGIYRLSRTVYDHRVSLRGGVPPRIPARAPSRSRWPTRIRSSSPPRCGPSCSRPSAGRCWPGVVALVATASRPNGALLLVSLALVVIAAWPADGLAMGHAGAHGSSPSRSWPRRLRSSSPRGAGS